MRHWELLLDVHPVDAARAASVSVLEGSLGKSTLFVLGIDV